MTTNRKVRYVGTVSDFFGKMSKFAVCSFRRVSHPTRTYFMNRLQIKIKLIDLQKNHTNFNELFSNLPFVPLNKAFLSRVSIRAMLEATLNGLANAPKTG